MPELGAITIDAQAITRHFQEQLADVQRHLRQLGWYGYRWKLCKRCGMVYEPVMAGEHNQIHG